MGRSNASRRIDRLLLQHISLKELLKLLLFGGVFLKAPHMEIGLKSAKFSLRGSLS